MRSKSEFVTGIMLLTTEPALAPYLVRTSGERKEATRERRTELALLARRRTDCEDRSLTVSVGLNTLGLSAVASDEGRSV